MSFTVVPLHNLSLPTGTEIPFGSGFVLQDVPVWVRSDEHALNRLSYSEKQRLSAARHALVAEYEASAIGEPDPNWKGKEPRSIQASTSESAVLANLALWLAQPSPVSFTTVLYALSWSIPGQTEQVPIIQSSETEPPLHCHPNDAHATLSVADALRAGELHAILSTVQRGNPVWEALRSFWAALKMPAADARYAFYWMGLESLFGANDPTEIMYKLCQRLAFFLADSPETARELFGRAKRCYRTRNKIIHGRWEHDPLIDAVMADTESIVRPVVRRLLNDPRMLRTFTSKQRDAFLEDWVFSRSTEPPPFPNELG